MDSTNKLIIDFALVMVLLLVTPILSARLRLPDIVGLILVGVVFGQHGLGLFNLEENQTFVLLGAIGLLYLMFLAGLEINTNEFHRYRRPGLIFGSITFLIPQVLGALGARWLLGMNWPTSILLASMFASHTLLPFPIAQRFGVSRNRGVTATIGATILTDTAALLVLAIIVQRYSPQSGGADMWFWGQMILMIAALLVGAIYVLPRIAYWFFRRATPDGTAEYIFVLAALFIMSYAAHLAKVHFIIGAFLAGLALSPLLPGRGVLTNRVHFVGHALFIPFFLLSVGMQVNLRDLASNLRTWQISAYMVIGVTFLKWLAAHISSKILGYTRDESGIMFGLSVNQAAATLAAVLVGVNVGIFDTAVLDGTILMILVTCLIGPWVTERSARRLAEQEAQSPQELKHVTGRVLVPISAPENTAAIIDLALMIRPDRSTEPLYPLSVVLDGPDVNERLTAAERTLGVATGHALAANAPVIPLARIDMNVVGGILRAAMEFRVSTVVLGWQLPRKHIQFFHSIPELVTAQGGQMIMVYRPSRPLNTVKRMWFVLPPLIEKHPGALSAVATARRIAAQAGAKIRFVATATTLNAIRKLPGLKPAISDADTDTIAAWGDADDFISQNYNVNDSIILLSSRRARLAWQPSLERLPVEWANRWPECNIIIMYAPLAEMEMAEEMLEEEAEEGREMVPEERVVLKPVLKYVISQSVSDALREMLPEIVTAGLVPMEKLVAGVVTTGAVPLSPDIVLMHTHTELVNRSRIVVGTNEKGFRFKGYKTTPTKLVLLLSPVEGPPEQHLHALAAIARGVRDGALLRGEELKLK